MTVTEKSSRKVILGSGWANPLTHDYMVENASYVHVFADDYELVGGVDYTVTDVNNPAGYAVTITVPGSWTPTEWVLDARPPIAQGKDLTLGGTFGAKFEDAVDQLTRRVQRVYDLARRGLKTGMNEAVGDNPYTLPEPEAGALLGWNAAGDDLENKASTGGGLVVPTFWQTVLSTASAAAAWLALQVLGSVPSRTLLKALTPTAGMAVYLSEGNRYGIFTAVYGAIPFSDPSEGVFIQSNTVGWYWERRTTVVNPAMFGATLNPADDNGPAVQACFTFVAQTYSGVTGNYLYRYDDARYYGTSQPINNINRQAPGWRAGTIALIGRCAGKIVFECGGLNVGTIDELNIVGDEDSAPAVGAYFGRMKVGGVINAAANMRIKSGRIHGWFTKVAYLQFAAEVSDVALNIENNAKGGSAVGYMNVGHWGTVDDYIGGLTSDFGTFPTAADGSKSNILHKIDIPGATCGVYVYLTILNITKANPGVVYIDPTALAASGLVNGDKIYGGEIQGMIELFPGPTNPTGVYTIANINLGAGTFELQGINTSAYSTFTSGHLRCQSGISAIFNGTAGATWDNAYVLSYGNPGIVLDVKNGIVLRDLFIGFSKEPQGQSMIRIDLPTAGQAELCGLQLDMLNQFQTFSDCLVQTNTAGGNVKLTNFKLNVRMMSNIPPNKIFGTPSKVTLNGFDITVPWIAAANDFSSAGGWFGGSVPSGVFRAGDTATVRLYGDTHEYRSNVKAMLRALSDLAGGTSGPFFDLYRDRNSANNDLGGVIRFLTKSAAGTERTLSQILQQTIVATDGAETSRIAFQNYAGGTNKQAGFVQDGSFYATDSFYVANVKVVGQQATGWTVGTGTINKGAFAAYAGATMSAAYVQAEAQATNDAARNANQRLLAIEQALRTHGLIN